MKFYLDRKMILGLLTLFLLLFFVPPAHAQADTAVLLGNRVGSFNLTCVHELDMNIYKEYIRRLRGKKNNGGNGRLLSILIWVVSLLGLLIIVGLIVTWVSIINPTTVWQESDNSSLFFIHSRPNGRF